MFLNRKAEISLLENLYTESRPKLILLHGKRRVGKTELLNEFSRRHRALYLVARQETYEGQLKKMSAEIAEFFDDDVLKHSPFQNYDALFIYLAQKELLSCLMNFPILLRLTGLCLRFFKSTGTVISVKKKLFLSSAALPFP